MNESPRQRVKLPLLWIFPPMARILSSRPWNWKFLFYHVWHPVRFSLERQRPIIPQPKCDWIHQSIPWENERTRMCLTCSYADQIHIFAMCANHSNLCLKFPITKIQFALNLYKYFRMTAGIRESQKQHNSSRKKTSIRNSWYIRGRRSMVEFNFLCMS